MARERPDYRDTIEQLNRMIPDRELLTMDDMFTITGYRSKTSIRANFPTVCGGRFNKTTVARILAGGK